MKNREWVYAVIAVLSFILMAVSFAVASMNAGDAGVGMGELVPSIGFALLFLVNIVLAKQNRRR